jgi:acyl-CoA reductase-like NAD-dependent aldehyde dehydrogenase
MAGVIQVASPFSGEAVAEVPLLAIDAASRMVAVAGETQRAWRKTPLAERLALVERFEKAMLESKEKVAREISLQMGKPLGQARGEVDGMIGRSQTLRSLAAEALAEVAPAEKAGFTRRVVREPLGVVLNIAPWNYPLLTVVNVVVPAVLAGNAVIIKHAPQTPLCGPHFVDAFARAGAPAGLVSALQADHATIGELLARPGIDHLAFTGSVRGGHEVQLAAARRFIGVGLELGGKDPGYVAADANFGHAVENLVDGAFYNAGQSCCGIERIYVHSSLYDRFVEAAVALVKQYQLGDPLDANTTMGPMTLSSAPRTLAEHVADARRLGGRVLTGGEPAQVGGKGRFFAPTVVADAPQRSALMQEESFGPVVGILPVKDDEEAVRLMNDSHYGLTAAIWTEDPARAERMARDLDTGTVFMNRCDFLDPALPWVGVKDSGVGASLSLEGFRHLTRPKSLHFRLKTS